MSVINLKDIIEEHKAYKAIGIVEKFAAYKKLAEDLSNKLIGADMAAKRFFNETVTLKQELAAYKQAEEEGQLVDGGRVWQVIQNAIISIDCKDYFQAKVCLKTIQKWCKSAEAFWKDEPKAAKEDEG